MFPQLSGLKDTPGCLFVVLGLCRSQQGDSQGCGFSGCQ